MKINSLSIIAFLLFLSVSAFAQKEMPLYDGPIRNSKPDTVAEKRGEWGQGHFYLKDITHPTLTAFLPEAGKSVGTSVIICPGGGYTVVAMGH
ncbi:MAG: hypothetical protein ABJA71_12025 [Ginsengibacter sp.]